MALDADRGEEGGVLGRVAVGKRGDMTNLVILESFGPNFGLLWSSGPVPVAQDLIPSLSQQKNTVSLSNEVLQSD